MARGKKIEVGVGTTFFATYADSEPEWIVVGPKGTEAWTAKVTSEDWNGVEKTFSGDEIRGAIAQREHWSDLRNENDKWWAERKIGEVVHYVYGHNYFVRGEIEREGAQKVMRCIGLVGNWSEFDLPQRQPNGEVYYPHYPALVRGNRTMNPNFSNMYEYQIKAGYYRGTLDPTELPALDLSVPDATPQQEEDARVERLRLKLAELLRGDDARQSLTAAKALIEGETW